MNYRTKYWIISMMIKYYICYTENINFLKDNNRLFAPASIDLIATIKGIGPLYLFDRTASYNCYIITDMTEAEMIYCTFMNYTYFEVPANELNYEIIHYLENM